MGLVDLEQLGHPRHDVRLRDGLSFRDAQGVVAVRDFAVLLADEALTRNPAHRGEHALVADSHTPQVARHLGALSLVVHAAEILRRSSKATDGRLSPYKEEEEENSDAEM